MASPQTANGFTRIANELLEALCRIKIPSESRRVFDAIMRKTYGYNRKRDRISLSQLSDISGLSIPHVCRAVKKLERMKLIVIESDSRKITAYRINKNYETWLPLPKQALPEIVADCPMDTIRIGREVLPELAMSTPHAGNQILPGLADTKETKTLSKDSASGIRSQATIKWAEVEAEAVASLRRGDHLK